MVQAMGRATYQNSTAPAERLLPRHGPHLRDRLRHGSGIPAVADGDAGQAQKRHGALGGPVKVLSVHGQSKLHLPPAQEHRPEKGRAEHGSLLLSRTRARASGKAMAGQAHAQQARSKQADRIGSKPWRRSLQSCMATRRWVEQQRSSAMSGTVAG
eukprot:753332-Hanusia_phi.AAC.1